MRTVRPRVDFDDLTWFKASASGENGACVEVACASEGWIALRDSKDRSGPKQLFTSEAWAAFIGEAKDGQFTP